MNNIDPYPIQIYFSPEQCKILKLPYYDSVKTDIKRLDLLFCLGGGDLYHKKILEKCIRSKLIIERKNGHQEPGWYNLQTIDIESF